MKALLGGSSAGPPHPFAVSPPHPFVVSPAHPFVVRPSHPFVVSLSNHHPSESSCPLTRLHAELSSPPVVSPPIRSW